MPVQPVPIAPRPPSPIHHTRHTIPPGFPDIGEGGASEEEEEEEEAEEADSRGADEEDAPTPPWNKKGGANLVGIATAWQSVGGRRLNAAPLKQRSETAGGAEPCALYTSGVSSAWLVDLFEAVILAIPTGRTGAVVSNRPGRTLFTVVFRTFHVDNTQPTPVYKARLFLAVTWRTSHNHGPVDQSNPMGKASVWQYHTGRHSPFPRYFPDDA